MLSSPWRVVHLVSRNVWLPNVGSVGELLEVGRMRQVGSAEADWEPGALVPMDTWGPVDLTGGAARVASFRIDRDVALIRAGTSGAGGPPEQVLRDHGPIQCSFGVRQDEPRRRTLTIHPHHKRYLGLHVDNWEELPVAERHLSHNRASLNLGDEARSFLFADLDIIDGCRPDEVPRTGHAHRIVRRGDPPPPVLRLTIPPGWTYLAPTENLLHDGSSIDRGVPTRHASALGRFTPVEGETDVVMTSAPWRDAISSPKRSRPT